MAGQGGRELARSGGSLRLDDGSQLVWSVADGRRGRRWREATERGGRLVASTLVECSPDGRFERLELATAAGLLTLHPSDDRMTLHGNAVTRSGIRHLAFDWGPDHRILVAGSVASVSVASARLETARSPAAGATYPGVAVDGSLRVGEGSVRLERIGVSGWILEADGGVRMTVRLDADGLPAIGTRWPLELEAPA